MADLFPFVIGNPKRLKIKSPGVGLITFFCVGASDVFDSAGELGGKHKLHAVTFVV